MPCASRIAALSADAPLLKNSGFVVSLCTIQPSPAGMISMARIDTSNLNG
jgi:hypothetical protein